MARIFDPIVKIGFGSIFIAGGIWIPTLVEGDNILQCDRAPAIIKSKPSTVTCEVLKKGGNSLLWKGTKIVDREVYPDIRKAEVAVVHAEISQDDTVRKYEYNRLVLVFSKGKQVVPLSQEDRSDMAGSIANQINLLIKNPQAPKIDLEISAGLNLTRAIGWAAVVLGFFVFWVKVDDGNLV
jgi:hypothetical protein